MVLSAKIGKIDAPSTATTVTVTGLGFQPKAVIFWLTMRTTDGVIGGIGSSIAFVTSTASADHFAIGCGSDDNAATTNTANTQGPYSGRITSSSATASTVAATLSAVSSDGFTVDFSITSNDIDIFYLALGGDSLTNAKAGSFAKKTSTGTQAVTGVGFQPDCVLFIPSALTSSNRGSNGYMSFGAYKSSTKRFGIAVDAADGSAAGDSDRYFSTSNSLLRTLNTGAFAAQADVQSFDSDGFTLNYTTSSGSADDVGYLALKGANVEIGTLTIPASTGIQTISGLGFRPAAIILAGIESATTESSLTDWAFGFGAATATAERGAIWSSDKNAADPTISKSASRSDLAYVSYSQVASPAVVNAADLSAFNITSVDLNWTSVSGSPTVGYIILGPGQGPIESAAAALTASSGGTAAGVDTRGASVAPSASGTLTVSATETRGASATPNSSGNLVTSGALTSPAAAALSATGTLTSGSTGDVPAATALSASGTFDGTGVDTRAAIVDISATGTLTADATVIQASGDIFAAAAVSATSGGTITGSISFSVAATVDGNTDLIADAFNDLGAVVDVSATSDETTVPNVVRNVSASWSASSGGSVDAFLTVTGGLISPSSQAVLTSDAVDTRVGAVNLTTSGTAIVSGVFTRVGSSAIAGNTNFVANIPSGFEEFGFAQFTASGTVTINGTDVPFQEFEQTTISKRADLLDALFRRLDSRVDSILYDHQDATTSYSSIAVGLDTEGVLRTYATVVTDYPTDTVTITPIDISTLTQEELDAWPALLSPQGDEDMSVQNTLIESVLGKEGIRVIGLDDDANTINHDAVVVGTSATLVRASNQSRVSLLVQNLGAVPIYLGGNAVTANNGLRVPAGATISELKVRANLYAIASSGTCDVRWFEEAL